MSFTFHTTGMKTILLIMTHLIAYLYDSYYVTHIIWLIFNNHGRYKSLIKYSFPETDKWPFFLDKTEILSQLSILPDIVGAFISVHKAIRSRN